MGVTVGVARSIGRKRVMSLSLQVTEFDSIQVEYALRVGQDESIQR